MVELRDYTMEIVEQYATYKNTPINFDNGYDKTPNPYTLAHAEEFIKIQLGKKPAPRKLIYWEDQFVGEIGADIKKDVFRLTAEIGYFIAAPFWGNGIASKAIALIIDYIFNNFEVIRIEAGVFDFNKSSMRVLEKNGFQLESIRKNAVVKNGKIIDDYIWVKLKETAK